MPGQLLRALDRADRITVSAPRASARVLVAAVIGLACALVEHIRNVNIVWHPTDFGQSWFGAVALRAGANPYKLIGPGLQYDWPWPMYYPATSMIVSMPLSFLPETTAVVVFIGLSCGLLAYGLTAEGWYRLPLFLSWPFLVALIAGQWSPILTAAALIPSLAWILVAKPNLGLAIFASSNSRHLVRTAFIGGLAITVASLAFDLEWPRDWIQSISSQNHIRPPIIRLGGVVVLLAALRWRRPEARLLLVLGCVPQTSGWYDVLPLFLIPATFRESLLLSSLSFLGYFLPPLIMSTSGEADYNRKMGALIVALCYLPATIMVLRRPNVGERPAWVDSLVRLWRKFAIQYSVP